MTGTIEKTNKRKLSAVDYVAAAMFLLLVFFLALCARNGIGVPDEAYYLSFAQRVFNGDGLISDEWHIAQFSSFILYPFYALFRWSTGSTEGIILYFRCLYIFFQCLCAVICWPAFRRYGFKGLFGLAFFAFFTPLSIMAVNYYTAPQWSAMILASAFLREKKPKKLLLFVYGILIALMVVVQPMTALLWFAYTIAVLVCFLDTKRQKQQFQHGSFLLQPHTFRFLLYGILATSALFLLYLFKNNSLSEIAVNFTYLFTGKGHDFTTGDFFISAYTLKEVLRYYGKVPVYGIVALTLLTFLLRRHRTAVRPFILLILLLLTTLALYNSRIASANGLNDLWMLYMFFGMPLYLSGPVCMMLLEKRDKRLEAFWWSTFAIGLLTDISSNIVIGTAIFSAGSVSAILMLLLLTECFRSFRTASLRWKRIASAVASVLLALTVVENIGSGVLFDLNRIEKSFIEDYSALDYTQGKADRLLDKGPMKGLYTTATIERIYNDYLSDLDSIRSVLTGHIYVYGLYGYMYLYLCDAPSSSCSAWYSMNEEPRQWEYFCLHSEKIPEYIFIPRYYAFTYRTLVSEGSDLTVEHKLQNMQNWFECDITEGKAGLILHVTGVKHHLDALS